MSVATCVCGHLPDRHRRGGKGRCLSIDPVTCPCKVFMDDPLVPPCEPPMPEAVGVHHCHALGCPTPVPPEMLMCKRHWFMVPQEIRNAVWRTYRPGQCDDKMPSRAWLAAAKAAIKAVAAREGRRVS